MTPNSAPHLPPQGQGLILSRRTLRRQNKDIIELWLATPQGAVCVHSNEQSSVCFAAKTHSASLYTLIKRHQLAIQIEDRAFQTLDHEPVILLRSENEMTQHQLRRYAEAENIVLFEADIKPADRFLMERFAYGAVSYKGTPNHHTIVDANVKGCQFRPELKSASIDIECDEHENLFSIAIASDKGNYVFLNCAHTSSDILPPKNLTLQCLKDEKQTLLTFCQTLIHLDPDIILGWNVKQFDMAVLYRMAERNNIKLKIGRAGSALHVRKWDDGTQVAVDVPGRCVIDGIEALKTMTYQFERFTLDNVAHELLGKRKLIQSDDRLEEIKQLYKQTPDKLIQYNLQDCILVNDIAAKTKLIDFLVLRSALTGLDMSRPGGSVAAFINVYLPKLHRAGYVSGVRPKSGGLASPGGYVMTSKPGLYENVLVLDFKSLYPSIIRTFLIDPMGLAEGLKAPDKAISGFKGACFSRDKHFLPAIITRLWAQRDEAKRTHDTARSQAIKILMNSFYGVLGSSGCPFYDPRLASSITLRGHEIMQTTAKWIEEKGYEVIYGDTDSTFVHIGQACDEKEAQDIGHDLQNTINQRWQHKLEQEFNLPCHLEIEFETHFHRFFMPTIRGSEEGSKKRYAGVTVKGNKKKLIFKGLENVRSDWTPLARQFQEALYTRIFDEMPVTEFIVEQLRTLRQGKSDDLLVYSRRLRKPLSSYTRTQPPHVKAARHANAQNLAAGKPPRYQNSTTVQYVMTMQGPQTVEHATVPYNYEHYVDKQIKPIADSILAAIGQHFDDIDNQQLGLF
ncbi:DNA polymerase II [Alteromonas sp. C1M14]|uniref:DNA polymerase II n=1 Tax=Alteromonas sp. C1M14 TaxID=2841567 RepID=UPI001C07F4D8|nr:DNA polymerase II [Alteromonas sp. C1M14]MBU2979689.1 DNA polymerase II [Alteromonas sp. C1M14]